jgi:hypothetical protein
MRAVALQLTGKITKLISKPESTALHMSTDVPPINFQQYAVDLSAAVSRQDGASAASILSLQDRLAIQRIYQGLPYSTARSPPENPHLQELKRIFATSQLDHAGQSAWSSVASKHIATIVHLAHDSDPHSAQLGDQHQQLAFQSQLDLAKYVRGATHQLCRL